MRLWCVLPSWLTPAPSHAPFLHQTTIQRQNQNNIGWDKKNKHYSNLVSGLTVPLWGTSQAASSPNSVSLTLRRPYMMQRPLSHPPFFIHFLMRLPLLQTPATEPATS